MDIVENMNVLWFIGSLAFLAGILCGAFVYHILSGSKTRNGKLETQLDELQQEFKEYQQQVGDHFTTSAHLVNKMTDTYRDIHEHLATGAESLCKDEDVKNRLNDSLLGSNALISGKVHKRRSERTPPLEQPKDYAPKNNPEEQGALSEDYGIKTEPEKEVDLEK
ncbi:YhcB family protein [Endozoicomonas ascidiicola]|uniref:YhcB family protein n=1 Tax=Endozoicomonas ascidiicola TaxID=1698521 RepID=UPI00082E3D08|nr:DUF1043 family protein [Endozoicomonas ascidiicola]